MIHQVILLHCTHNCMKNREMILWMKLHKQLSVACFTMLWDRMILTQVQFMRYLLALATLDMVHMKWWTQILLLLQKLHKCSALTFSPNHACMQTPSVTSLYNMVKYTEYWACRGPTYLIKQVHVCVPPTLIMEVRINAMKIKGIQETVCPRGPFQISSDSGEVFMATAHRPASMPYLHNFWCHSGRQQWEHWGGEQH